MVYTVEIKALGAGYFLFHCLRATEDLHSIGIRQSECQLGGFVAHHWHPIVNLHHLVCCPQIVLHLKFNVKLSQSRDLNNNNSKIYQMDQAQDLSTFTQHKPNFFQIFFQIVVVLFHALKSFTTHFFSRNFFFFLK